MYIIVVSGFMPAWAGLWRIGLHSHVIEWKGRANLFTAAAWTLIFAVHLLVIFSIHTAFNTLPPLILLSIPLDRSF